MTVLNFAGVWMCVLNVSVKYTGIVMGLRVYDIRGGSYGSDEGDGDGNRETIIAGGVAHCF